MADTYRQAAQVVDDAKPVFVGYVVADKYRSPTMEWSMLQIKNGYYI